MVLAGPERKAVTDELSNHRPFIVQGISNTAFIDDIAFVVGPEPVVRNSRPERTGVPACRDGVVVDNIHHQPNPRAVEGLHKLLDFPDGSLRIPRPRCVLLFRDIEERGLIAPVIVT